MRTVKESFDPKNNNFDVIRLAAATAVLWSHSYSLTGNGPDPFSKAFHLDTGGGLGVIVFFSISGFLVTKSAIQRSVSSYAAGRLTRILPALALVVFATVFLLGPSLTKLSLADYFKDSTTLSYLKNALVFHVHYQLADTVTDLHVKAINGSLWTLPLECGFYIILIILTKIGLLRRRSFFIIILVFLSYYFYAEIMRNLSPSNVGKTVWSGAVEFWALRCAIPFIGGAAIFVYREYVPLHLSIVALLLACVYVSPNPAVTQFCYLVAVTYSTIFIALLSPLKIKLHRMGDLSYGIYLIAFPIQQSFIIWFGIAHATALTIAASPVVFGLAFLSWHFIEKPSLQLKSLPFLKKDGTSAFVVSSPEQ